MTTTHLLYLHGFRSSPQSAKARLTAERVAAQHPGVFFWCPQLPPSPRAAMALVAAGIAHWPQGAGMAVIGSSLGGYYASWHDPEERFFFRPEFVDELRALDVSHLPPAAPELLIAAQGDELLDWREMVARYPQAQQRVLEGGDHALSSFPQQLAEVLRFCDLAP